MAEVFRTYGLRLGAVLWLLVAIWGIGLVAAPLVDLAVSSVASGERSSIDTIAELARLRDDLRSVRRTWESTAEVERRADLDRRIRLLTDRARRLEARVAPPETEPEIGHWARFTDTEIPTLATALGRALLATAVSLVLCYPVAWAAVLASRRRHLTLVLFALAVPVGLGELLRAVAWRTTFAPAGDLADPIVSVMVAAAAIQVHLLFMVVPIHAALARVDRRLIEAARDLGASTLRIHARILLPHAAPGLALGSILTFALAAGSLAVPRVVSGEHGARWFAPSIARHVSETGDLGLAAAEATALTVACLVLAVAALRLFRLRLRDLVERRRGHG